MDVMSDIRFLEGSMLTYLASLRKCLLPTECEPAGVRTGQFPAFQGRSSRAGRFSKKMCMPAQAERSHHVLNEA